MSNPVNIFWFRRDLRLEDNAGLYHALRSDKPVQPVFIFDRNILDKLDDKSDRRVEYIHAALEEIQEQLGKKGGSLRVYYDTAEKAWKKILGDYKVDKVFTNHDYEPYAKDREAAIEKLLIQQGASLHTYKDQVIFEKNEVMKDDGTPYTVFTPYSRKWKTVLMNNPIHLFPGNKFLKNVNQQSVENIPSLQSMRFRNVDKPFPSKQLKEDVVKKYSAQRNFPAIEGTTRMGVHLRFGTISIRQLAQTAMALNETYLNELIWRDFYHMILWHFPRVGLGKSFKPEYDFIAWRSMARLCVRFP